MGMGPVSPSRTTGRYLDGQVDMVKRRDKNDNLRTHNWLDVRDGFGKGQCQCQSCLLVFCLLQYIRVDIIHSLKSDDFSHIYKSF